MIEIYTSYYANADKFDTDKYALFSIAGKAPGEWEFSQYKKLAPSWDIWKSWHDRMEKAREAMYREEEENLACQIYTDRFNSEILGNLDPDTVFNDIMGMADGKIPVLFCYETPGKFCHRHLVADWLMKNIEGLTVTEYGEKKTDEPKTELTNLEEMEVAATVPPNCCRGCMHLVVKNGEHFCANPNRIQHLVRDGVMAMVDVYAELEKNWLDSKCFENITNDLIGHLQEAVELFSEYRTNREKFGYGLMSPKHEKPNSIGYCSCYSGIPLEGNSI